MAIRYQPYRIGWTAQPSLEDVVNQALGKQFLNIDESLQALFNLIKLIPGNVSGLIDLTSEVTGILPIANGGTGADNAADARTNLGLEIGVDIEAHDVDLDALAALSGTGYIVRTGSGTATTRTLQAGTNISISNPDGVAGDSTISVTGSLGVSQAVITGDIELFTNEGTGWSVHNSSGEAKGASGSGWSVFDSSGTAKMVTVATGATLAQVSGAVGLELQDSGEGGWATYDSTGALKVSSTSSTNPTTAQMVGYISLRIL